MLHAHIETYAVDCDGPISRDYVLTMSDDELASDFGDIEFHDRVVSSVVNTYSLAYGGQLEVRKLDDGTVTLEWSEPTEEGHRNTTARICSDEGCDLGETHYRDHRAEEAGY